MGVVPGTILVTPDTSDLQAIVDAMPEGGILALGPGVYTVPDGGLVINKPLELCGTTGAFNNEAGVWLTPYADAANQPVIVIARSATMIGQVYIHDLNIAGDMDYTPPTLRTYRSGSHGISITTSDTTSDQNSNPLSRITLKRIIIGSMAHDGIYAVGYDGSTSAINNLTIEQVQVNYCTGDGMNLEACVIAAVRDCYINRNGGRGLRMVGGGYNVHNTVIEGNATDDSLDHYLDAQVVAYGVRPFSFIGNHIEDFADGGVTTGVPDRRVCRGLVVYGSCSSGTSWEPLNGFDGGGFRIEGNIFVNDPEVTDNLVCSPTLEPRGIYIDNSVNGYFTIGTNFFRNANVPIEVAAPSAHAAPGISVEAQQVEIGGTYVAADGLQLLRSAAAQVRDHSSVVNMADLGGHLIYDTTIEAPRALGAEGVFGLFNRAPKVTTVQRDAATWSAGDIIWNTTTNNLECYTGSGTTWKTVCSMA